MYVQVEQLAQQHDPRLDVDCCRVYHFGARYNVEMEVVLPGDMTVIESHDIALELQHKIEALSDVERAFVHVPSPTDYAPLQNSPDLLRSYLMCISFVIHSSIRWIISEGMD